MYIHVYCYFSHILHGQVPSLYVVLYHTMYSHCYGVAIPAAIYAESYTFGGDCDFSFPS